MTSDTVNFIFLLMIVFQVKHFVADFILQHNYMLKKIRPQWDFILPLTLHCLVHGVMTLLICLVFRPDLWWLSAVDFFTHFFLDRLRSGPRYLGRYNDVHKKSFWVILGLDQMLHQLTHIYLVWAMVFY